MPLGAQTASSDWQKEGGQGQPKTIIYSTSADGQTFKKVKQVAYNPAGNVTEELIFTASTGDLETRWVYERDAQGNLLKKIGYNPKSEPQIQFEFKYEAGLMVEKIQSRLLEGKLSPVRTIKYTHTPEKQVAEEREYDKSSKLLAHNKYEYYPEGMLKKLTVVVGWVDFFYNEQKQLTSTKFYDDSKTFNALKLFTYNDKGAQASLKEFQASDLANPTNTEMDAYVYDAKGNWVEHKVVYLSQKFKITRREIQTY